jgi:GNAT superfamily N-acetyltransferase
MKSTLLPVSPSDPELWRAYHTIRREVLWEARGRDDYQENHPDELAEGHFPMVFCVDGNPLGVIRIDLNEESREATFRRVAVTPWEQRKGFGRRLMEEAEKFALGRGCQLLVANVAADAIPFYEKIGYTFELGIVATANSNHPRMIKKRSV